MLDRPLPFATLTTCMRISPRVEGDWLLEVMVVDHWSDHVYRRAEYRCDDIDTVLMAIEETVTRQEREEGTERRQDAANAAT